NCELARSAGGSGIADRDRAVAKEKRLQSRERQLEGKRQRLVGGRNASWRLEICRDFAAAGVDEICDQENYWLFENKIAGNALIFARSRGQRRYSSVIPSASEGPHLHSSITQTNLRRQHRAREVPRRLRGSG